MCCLWQLLEKDRRKRLGCGPRDFEEIRQHSFFRDLSWDDLNQRKIPPCYRPELVSIHQLPIHFLYIHEFFFFFLICLPLRRMLTICVTLIRNSRGNQFQRRCSTAGPPGPLPRWDVATERTLSPDSLTFPTSIFHERLI